MQMAKVTLNDIEYDSDNFNDSQLKLLAELQFSSTVKRQLDFQIVCNSLMAQALMERFKESLEEEDA
tara:strand:- start:1311 stop:1511 length:201 start_codon:yes stop_codon:yes gene_type:complete